MDSGLEFRVVQPQGSTCSHISSFESLLQLHILLTIGQRLGVQGGFSGFLHAVQLLF